MEFKGRNYAFILLFMSFALIIKGLRAHIAEFDEYWQNRAEAAKKATVEAYQPNPAEVTNNLNFNVDK